MLVCCSVSQSVNWSVNPSVDWSVNLSGDWSVDHSVDCSFNWSVRSNVSLSVCPWNVLSAAMEYVSPSIGPSIVLSVSLL